MKIFWDRLVSQSFDQSPWVLTVSYSWRMQTKNRTEPLRWEKVSRIFLLICAVNLTVCTVCALYSKSGGKNGRYSSVTEKWNISAVSYLVVQVFEPVIGGTQGLEFQPKTDRMALLQTNEFAFLPSFCFLTMLSCPPSQSTRGLSVTVGDCDVFHSWRGHDSITQITKAIKMFKKKSRNDLDEVAG